QRRLPGRLADGTLAARVPEARQFRRRTIDDSPGRHRGIAHPTDATHPPMKIAIIGGAGVRTPLLVGGLTASALPIDEIALYDVDPMHLPIIGAVAARMAARGRITLCRSVAECVAWADFVFTSIRV